MAFEPERKEKITLQCPLKFSVPENGTNCIKEKCALWMPLQRACAFNCIARIEGLLKGLTEGQLSIPIYRKG